MSCTKRVVVLVSNSIHEAVMGRHIQMEVCGAIDVNGNIVLCHECREAEAWKLDDKFESLRWKGNMVARQALQALDGLIELTPEQRRELIRKAIVNEVAKMVSSEASDQDKADWSEMVDRLGQAGLREQAK